MRNRKIPSGKSPKFQTKSEESHLRKEARCYHIAINNNLGIWLYYGEKIPHVHIIETYSNRRSESFVRLDCPEYLTHGSRRPSAKLSDDGKKALVEYLKEDHDNWNFIADAWSIASSNGNIGESVECKLKGPAPDYSKLP